ncbi:MAG TPA: nuclear transport factor 2 family protein [Caulobacteraceae bacterium]|nr:nuclear transport factor 2 family protein [Caulobacteraceae bacterium]
MQSHDTEALARGVYEAFMDKDRERIERLLSPDFTFTSPYDDHIGREAYFERCWPNSDRIKAMRIDRVIADGDDAFVLYDLEPRSGGSFRNTEFMRFEGGRLKAVEVYFGEVPNVTPKP